MAAPHTTRRELLRGGAVATAAAAVVLAVEPAAALSATSGAAAPAGDAALLASLLRVERVVVFAYERALASGPVSAGVQTALASFLAHERAHVRTLSARLMALGGTVPAAPASMAAFAAELHHLRVKRSPLEVHGERQELRFLIDLETVIAHHYRSALARLGADKLLTTAAEIMANEAQHATALAELLNPGKVNRAVPMAFVAGVGG